MNEKRAVPAARSDRPSDTVSLPGYEAAPSAPPARRRGPRPLTIRAKLSLVYGGTFLAAGLVLLVVDYYVVRWRLNHGRQGLPAWCRAGTTLTRAQVLSCDAMARNRTLDEIVIASLLTLVALGLLAVLLGYVMAGRFLAPLTRITATARRVANRPDRSLHARIELGGADDELRELADTFDEMLDRLDSAFDAQSRFVGNASHELRTPLAINRTLLEVALADPDVSPEVRGLAKNLLASNERSEAMIEGLLLLARTEGATITPQPVSLTEVVKGATHQCAAEASERGVRIRTSFQPATVLGDGVLLERVALNLIHNAMRYNVPGGGWVDVVTYDQGATALLAVANSGPRVPEYALGSLFEPFRRFRAQGEARPRGDRGAGLGLSIVRSVVSLHHGRLAVESRPEGGLIVRVWLPTVGSSPVRADMRDA